MPSQGYVRYPTIHEDSIVFVSEDDLWLVSSEGGRAERLTAGVGEVQYPCFSPDGKLLALVGHEEGPGEIYVMPAPGGMARRLTFQGAICSVAGWSRAGDQILYASNAGQFSGRQKVIYAISPDGGEPQQLSVGVAQTISYGPNGGVVIGRNTAEPARWKRYRGGTAGYFWCDADGDGVFQRLLRLDGNMTSPCWVGDRIYFISDHEGVGNIYSCTPTGEDLRRHTNHQDFYARNLASDGKRMVYHAGADLYLFDPTGASSQRLELELPSWRPQLNRKFVSAERYLDTYELHPAGYAVALTTRGKAFSMGNWEGPALQYGEPDGVRYRWLEWLNDGKRLVAVRDADGRENLIVFSPEDGSEPKTFPANDFGRSLSLDISPAADIVALTNHRNELIVADLEAGTQRVIDRSDYSPIRGVAWSPDGRWLAYGFGITTQKCALKLCNLESGETHIVTRPILQDVAPAFDPEGKYLYFIGYRIFNPVHDRLQFEMGFPRGTKPYVILLQRDLRSPFIPEPGAKEKEKEDGKKSQGENRAKEAVNKENGEDGESGNVEKVEEKAPIVIDLEGIASRVLPFPVPEGCYYSIYGVKGKALFLSFPVEGTLHDDPDHDPHEEPSGKIESYDFETYKHETYLEEISDFKVSRTAQTLIYRSRRRLRVLKAGEKPAKPEKGDRDRPGRENGWLDLKRLKVSVQPTSEWKQMFYEAWRLQREHFWVEDMSGINWQAIYDQYAPLVERVSSRSELSDLFWEMQGELGTSHAYELGGEYRRGPHYRQGFLGVDWAYDVESDRYRIARIVEGDTADRKATSPLTTPGLNVTVGDAVLAINGQRVRRGRGPQELLVNQAHNEVQLTIEAAESKEVRVVTVKTLASEYGARYRDWVESNRQKVYELSDGRVGYIHIPDMVASGFAEFHRSYLTEYDAPALLIDVRWNSGGNVSGLLLEKLARRRLGYDFPRWGPPVPYPSESPRGPMVALTNENAGSDGDIFCHSFKLMGLGPLIGKRTWGGVIGITLRHRLVDSTLTTQPEFSFWFKDVGWRVENYGTDPDIEVDITPQDYASGQDPQLERAVAEALKQLETIEVLEPKPGERPRLGR